MNEQDPALEFKVGERTYRLQFDPQSNLTELLGVICEFQYYVMSQIKESQIKQADQSSVTPDEILPKEE